MVWIPFGGMVLIPLDNRWVNAQRIEVSGGMVIYAGTVEDGGRRGDRTPDLCIANAALSQLS